MSRARIPEGWAEHDGGKCPTRGERVSVMLRCGRQSTNDRLGWWIWDVVAPSPNDIVAYDARGAGDDANPMTRTPSP